MGFGQATSTAKIDENNNSELEHVLFKSIEFRKKFDLIKQIEEMIKPCRANNAELSDIEIMKNILLGYQA